MTIVARGVILSALILGAAVLCKWSPEVRGGGEAGVVMELPERVGDFEAHMVEPDAVEKKMLPADTEFAKALYSNSPHDESVRDVVRFGIVLSGAERRSIHRPEVCLVGQGWTILSSTVRRIRTGTRELAVRDLHIEKSVNVGGGVTRPLRAHYFYWFAGTDVTTPDHAERIWLTLKDNLLHGVNHRWAYVNALTLVTEGFTTAQCGERTRTDAETVRVLEQFIGRIAPKFQKSLMGEPPKVADAASR